MSTNDSTHSRSPRNRSPPRSKSSNYTETSGSSSRSKRKSRSRFTKSKTPPSRKNSTFSASSDEGSSEEDDFPKYRANWSEKSPESPGSSGRFYDDLKHLDDLLVEARSMIRDMLR